jgi:hypothetical protein
LRRRIAIPIPTAVNAKIGNTVRRTITGLVPGGGAPPARTAPGTNKTAESVIRHFYSFGLSNTGQALPPSVALLTPDEIV